MGLLARISAPSRYPDASRVSTSARTLAGVAVTPDNVITLATSWACIRYLTQTTAVLPWRAMLELANGRGADVARTHPVDWLLHKRPAPEWSSFQFRETLLHWALRWGNGYAEIQPDFAGRPYAMWPLHPERVDVCRATEGVVDDYGTEIARDEIFYEVRNATGGEKSVLASPRIFHIRGFGEDVVGVNVVHYAAESMGWAKAAQLFGSAFFGNGLMPAGVVINKRPLKEGGLKRQKQEFSQLFRGPRNAHRTAHLDNDADWKAIGFNARDSQLIDVHQHLVEEICRWFGVPPHKVMHLLRATFSNIEHQAIEVVQDSILPWAKRFEDEADFKLFGPANRRGYYTKINLRGLLRGDFKSQQEGLEVARRNGVIDADEWRGLIDMNPMPEGRGGDKRVLQSQYTTLEKIGEAPPPPSPAPAQHPDEDDDLDEDVETDAEAARAESRMRAL